TAPAWAIGRVSRRGRFASMIQMISRLGAALLLALAGWLVPAAAAAPQRIVAIGSDVVEIMIALGVEGRIVATDSSAATLPGMGEITKVGYMRSVSAEGILSQRPDLVLLSITAGPPDVLTQLRD